MRNVYIVPKPVTILNKKKKKNKVHLKAEHKNQLETVFFPLRDIMPIEREIKPRMRRVVHGAQIHTEKSPNHMSCTHKCNG